ncbi:TetR/AcrR family transcriptional regulator [Aquabacter sp. CN5-332]|uniref:TetR/AcrR family transcriptional regulator n=1 Tax=Aquabacter sp. CN5-332 TaxID=3156608 RepID=UPI0032B3A5CF
MADHPTLPPQAPKRAADRIRESARELFYAQGIRAVGVDQIVTKAGVTKPSLYRAFPSKDALAADYLRTYDEGFWQRFEEAAAEAPGDPRGQIRAFFARHRSRVNNNLYRGCALTNAAVEYPDADHPARKVAEEAKTALRTRLRQMAMEMGARDPEALGDGLMLIMEGAFVTSQLFGKGGPAVVAAEMADRLIEASLKPAETAD